MEILPKNKLEVFSGTRSISKTFNPLLFIFSAIISVSRLDGDGKPTAILQLADQKKWNTLPAVTSPAGSLLVWSKNQSSVTQLLIDCSHRHYGELCGGELLLLEQ